MNSISVLGRLVKDPVLKKTTNNKPYIYFTVASKQGGNKTNFIPCIAFNTLAETICNYCKKGTRMFIEGYLETVYNENKGNNIVKIRYMEFADNKVTVDESKDYADDIIFTVKEDLGLEDITDDLPF